MVRRVQGVGCEGLGLTIAAGERREVGVREPLKAHARREWKPFPMTVTDSPPTTEPAPRGRFCV